MNTAVAAQVPAAQVKAVRAFNRFYTQRIGVLDRYLGSDFSLSEIRVLYELAHREQLAAADLVREFGLDAGYLSRMLRRFESQGWITRTTSARDARQSLLRMTRQGHAAFAPMQQRSRDETAALLATVPPEARPRLVEALQTVQALLDPTTGGASAPAARQVLLRDPRPGDIGWVVQQHGEVYARECGFTLEFEALVADITAQFIKKFDPAADRCWIAEVDGQRAGSVFVVRRSATVAQLRLLILTPEARGLGLGGRLVDECIAFARAQGYRTMRLWTQSNRPAARAIYAGRGFVQKTSEPKHSYGQDVVVEEWVLKL
ncbi:bifunctional helix-turn-helix transcriptional regulator/GNAT family N-acetyltransferase [Ramlibacter sp.]|uniref:bifunctional helix-turn-helix transcriptional regulator/GNAT family N-acetyltransferase n=1 Tax=Ramlibacter sp. TaxID=1917967 RepID=UPI001856114E|nr:bifunctional helix-turn-helix transcriptional regulator/GNAT family N-acetyltransferase [Ramlibacter sp.]MBA2674060.1 bifunctional helix-turn-helix transcriptional regulator/GNAT family N-acetyltransferase [Ramlibacter sp.]